MFRFSNDLDGYIAFEEWVQNVSEKSAKMDILIGCEPTGHYWFTFAKYVKERGMKLAFVNPYRSTDRKSIGRVKVLIFAGTRWQTGLSALPSHLIFEHLGFEVLLFFAFTGDY